MKKFSGLMLCLVFAIVSTAQEVSPQDEISIHEFGIHAGATSGIGLSYRYWPEKFGIQVTLLPIKQAQETYVNVGFSFLQNFYHTRHIRFFGYLANNLVYQKNQEYDYNYDIATGLYGTTKTYYVEKTKYNIGFGPGFGFGTKVRINLMAGYGLYDILDEFNVFPTGEIGLYFRL